VKSLCSSWPGIVGEDGRKRPDALRFAVDARMSQPSTPCWRRGGVDTWRKALHDGVMQQIGREPLWRAEEALRLGRKML
jgi:hypothetical protein